ncbi:MAG: glycosyltransferase family 2 protein [Candidatus Thorarchaeota archaeon]
MIDTTLMMVTYNRLDLTQKTIDNLLKNTKHPCSLVVVDNGSKDDTPKYLQELQQNCNDDLLGAIKNVELILLPENKGIAEGRNRALKKADELKTKWYCTIDNDVQVPDGWLGKCIQVLSKNRNYGGIGVNMENIPYSLVTKNGCYFQDKPKGNLGTACMVFSKNLHKMIGFFSMEYGVYGLEDSDFGMRTRVAGFKLGYIKEMGIHIGADEDEKNEYRKFKTKQHSDYLVLFKQNCARYFNNQKPIFINYQEK